MHLVGRGQKLSTLAELLTRCDQGKGQIALVNGPVASGKTALLHCFAEHATSTGALFIGATASLSERSVPFGLISQILRSPELGGGPADPAVARLLEDGPPGPSTGGPGPGLSDRLPMELSHRLLAQVHEVTRRAPLVIAVDDVQHIDGASLAVLLYLLRRSKPLRVMFVLNGCTCPQERLPLLEAELHAQPHCRRISLKPLSATGVEQFAARHLDRPTAERLAPGLHRVTGGNPLLLRALIEDTTASATTAPLETTTPGETFAQAVAACLYRCDPLMVRVARTCAVLGDTADRDLLCEVLDSDADSTDRSIRALEAVGLLHDGRFRHEAARTAVLSGVLAGELAVLHSRAARALHDHGAPPRLVARQLAEASGLDAPWMVTALKTAADQEMLHGDPALAVRYLRQARSACTDERQRAQVTSSLAGAEWQIDPATIVRLLPELIKAVDQGLLTGRRHLVKLVTYLFWHGCTTQALNLTQRLRASTPQTPGTDALGNAMLLLPWLCPPMLAVDPERDTIPQELPSRATSLVNAVLDGQEIDDDLLIGAEQILLGARLDDDALSPILASLAALVYTDSLDRAVAWCAPLLKAAENRGARTWHALFSTVHAIIEVRRGSLPQAREHAERALTLLPPQSWGVAIGLPLAAMVQTATEMGNYQEAHAFLDIPVPPEMHQTLSALYYIRARGRYHVAIGQLHTALADFQSCGRLMAEWGLDQPSLLPWRSDAAVACLGLHLTSQARQLASEQLSMTAPTDHRTRGITLRVMARLSDTEERRTLLTTAAVALERCGDRVELARALADLSRAHSALGEHEEAEAAAEQAAVLAGECGAEPLLRSLLPSAVPDPQPAAPIARIELSDAEQRVAALAADGYTNREIATKLYITTSTVEQHLTRVYRKLGVNRRLDLSAALDSC
ncbi:ATP-binding protein [Kitasatospora sp. NPDC051170]|uniref:ATP-binding protein n=1 Tax=Kitasatospora sp. NPDC051170 TaxID=3364056 RepID=UPI00379C0BCC